MTTVVGWSSGITLMILYGNHCMDLALPKVIVCEYSTLLLPKRTVESLSIAKRKSYVLQIMKHHLLHPKCFEMV